jgi:hypothetical protein
VKLFNLKGSVPILIKNIDALTNEYERKTAQVKNSLDQEVDYERDAFSSKDKHHFLYHHKNNRYLLEKFVQLQMVKRLSDSELSKLLALIDKLYIYAL